MTGVAYPFLLVVLAALSASTGLFFVRYWRSSGDRFFLVFAVAFWALGANWALLAARDPDDEYAAYDYLLRLFAFLVIVVAIIDKNRRATPSD